MYSLLASARPAYAIDCKDRITWLNPAWIAQARRDGLDSLKVDALVGRPIWDYVSGNKVRLLWLALYEKVRVIRAPVFVPLRADTPGERRLIDLELHPLANGAILHVSECLWTEARSPVHLLKADCLRDSRQLDHCAWCNRIQVRFGVWEEVEQAEQTLGLKSADSLPMLQMAVCATCQNSVLQTAVARAA
jgi:hypothetical protein